MEGGALLGQGEERRPATLRDPTETAEDFIQTFAAVGPAEVGRGAQVELRCSGRPVRGPNRDPDGAGQEQRQPDFKPVGHAAVSPAPGRRCRRIDTLARRTAPRRRDDGKVAPPSGRAKRDPIRRASLRPRTQPESWKRGSGVLRCGPARGPPPGSGAPALRHNVRPAPAPPRARRATRAKVIPSLDQPAEDAMTVHPLEFGTREDVPHNMTERIARDLRRARSSLESQRAPSCSLRISMSNASRRTRKS